MIGFEKGRIEMRVPPWLVFAVSFAATLWLWHTTHHDNEEICRTRFQNRASLITARIKEAVEEQEKILRGGVGLFAAGTKVTRAAWHRYAGALGLENWRPGAQGLGFAQRVFSADLTSHVRSIQAEGFAS